MRSRKFLSAAPWILACASIWLAACSSGNGSTANVITVTVTPAAAVAVAGQQAAFTATVGGSTTTTVTWACTFTTTTTDSTGKTTTSTPASCDPGSSGYPKYGTLSDETQNVITYTAPALANFPNPVPTITLTAKATANTKKTGTTTITLDSGIRVSIAPTSVAVPVGLTPAQTVHFTASLLNSPPSNLNWILVQPNTSSTTTANQTANPLATTCSPTCGTMDSQGNGIFTAPASLPTDTTPPGSKSTSPTTVYLVVNSKTDTNHFAVATISLVSATTNPVTFTGIYPTVMAAGGVEQDVFLNTHNLLNTNTITFTPPGQSASAQVIDPSNIFTIPITAAYCTASATGVTPVVTCDASIVTRIRLTQAQLAVPESDPQFPGTITVNGIPDPSNPGSTKSVSYPIHLVYASPALAAAVPNSIPLGTNTSFSTDGGYYGGGGSPLVNLYFNGQLNGATSFGPRQFTGQLPVGQIAAPGLYPVSVKSNAPINPPPAAPPFSLATTNLAIQPTFSFINSISYNGSTPTNASTVTSMPFPGTSSAFPSSMIVNSNHQYALIAEQGASALQIVDLSSGKPVFANKAVLSCSDPSSGAAINCQPTSVSYTDTLNITGYPGDIAVVVDSAAQSLSLVSVPSGAILPQKVDLSKLLTAAPGGTLPTPYSVGVDPGTNLAVVAYSNSNVGFIVDLNPNDTQTCFLSTQSLPCAIAPVSLNTGANPQVVMQPQTPIAYVTPGGAGVTSVVNLLQSGTTANIASATNSPAGAVRTNSIVTITTTTPHAINPAVGGTVLISGVMPADLNGTYQVNPGSVTDPYTFSYTQTPPAGTTLKNETGGGGTVQYGSPYFTFTTTSTATGATINPITRTFAFADYNATIGQIGFINSLDQSVTSLTLTAGSCNGCTPNPSGAPETNFRSVAFDPYTNVLIAYNPSENSVPSLNGNKISLINPGGTTTTGSSNVTQSPYRIIAAIPVIDQNSVPTTPMVQVGTGVFTPSGTGATPITVQGPMAYDPRTRLVLVASAGSNTLSYMSLDQDPAAPFKKVQIQGMQVTMGGLASGQPPLGSGITAKCDPTQGRNPLMSCMAQAVTVGQQAQIRVFGEGFTSASPAFARLDANSSVACGSPVDPNSFCTTVVNDTEVDVNIPASMFTLPHNYALDVLVGVAGSGAAGGSNAIELHAVGILSLASACAPTTQFPQGPEGVAIDDTRHIALVTNYACNSVSIINLDNTNLYNKPYGAILGTLTVGANPIGVAVIPRLGYAVVANNGDTPVGTASIIDISNPLAAKVLTFTTTSGSTTTTTSSIPVGLAPTGVAIDRDHAYALVANSGSSTVSSIDLTVLLRATPTTPVAAPVAVVGSPKAIAIDPNRAIAVVTTLQNSGTTSVSAGLDVISLSTSPPVRSSSASISSLTANLTSIVYDPAVTPALFYATSTQQNAVYAFNPDSGGVQTIRVGVNPYSIAYNYQTGTMLTINSTSNTSSVVDTQTFRTAENLGISSQSQFSAAMDNVSNTVVIADQNNNRVLLLAMPK